MIREDKNAISGQTGQDLASRPAQLIGSQFAEHIALVCLILAVILKPFSGIAQLNPEIQQGLLSFVDARDYYAPGKGSVVLGFVVPGVHDRVSLHYTNDPSPSTVVLDALYPWSGNEQESDYYIDPQVRGVPDFTTAQTYYIYAVDTTPTNGLTTNYIETLDTPFPVAPPFDSHIYPYSLKNSFPDIPDAFTNMFIQVHMYWGSGCTVVPMMQGWMWKRFAPAI